MRNSRADVVAAALRVLDAHGLENCSMRRVAAELGVQPSALYHHVPDKQTLLALMADEIVHGVVAGSSAGPDGPVGSGERGESTRRGGRRERQDPAALCRSLRAAMLAVRDGADVVATAAAFRLGASDVEAALAEAVGPDGARTLLLYTFGHSQSTQTHRQAVAFAALADPSRPASAGSGPGSAAASGSHDEDLDASFDRGIAIILAGLGV